MKQFDSNWKNKGFKYRCVKHIIGKEFTPLLDEYYSNTYKPAFTIYSKYIFDNLTKENIDKSDISYIGFADKMKRDNRSKFKEFEFSDSGREGVLRALAFHVKETYTAYLKRNKKSLEER